MRRITPFLWFDGQAEQAAAFYVSIFPNSAIRQRSNAAGSRTALACRGRSCRSGWSNC